jgi:hypothetical protein
MIIYYDVNHWLAVQVRHQQKKWRWLRELDMGLTSSLLHTMSSKQHKFIILKKPPLQHGVEPHTATSEQ